MTQTSQHSSEQMKRYTWVLKW